MAKRNLLKVQVSEIKIGIKDKITSRDNDHNTAKVAFKHHQISVLFAANTECLIDIGFALLLVTGHLATF